MPDNTSTTQRSIALARLKVVYLLVVTGAVFTVPVLAATRTVRWFVVLGLLGVQLTTLLCMHIAVADILRTVDRLKWLFAFLIACYVLLPADPGRGHDISQWHVPGLGLNVLLNLSGLEQSSLMCLQILTLIIVSAVVQLSGSGHDLVDGLRGFGLPRLFVYSVDTTLAMLGGLRRRAAGGGGRRGRGRGAQQKAALDASQPHNGAQRTAEANASSPGFFAVLGRLLRGDVGFFISSIAENLERARTRVAGDSARSFDARLAHDAAVIAGVALGMMSLKMFRFLPGIPFASGHKTLLLFPLYIVAADLTSSRWGGTTAGSIMGVLGYLQGDGRFGVFEILKHLAPGLVIDILWPLGRRLPRSMFILCVLGFLAAIARTSTEFITMLLLGSRLEVYAFPLAKLIPNVVAGTLSGCVTYVVLPAFAQMRPDMGSTTPRRRVDAGQMSFAEPNIDVNGTAETLSRRSGRAGSGGRGGGHGGGGGRGGGHGSGGGRDQ
jgi:uncharacterized membrane protein YgcG